MSLAWPFGWRVGTFQPGVNDMLRHGLDVVLTVMEAGSGKKTTATPLHGLHGLELGELTSRSAATSTATSVSDAVGVTLSRDSSGLAGMSPVHSGAVHADTFSSGPERRGPQLLKAVLRAAAAYAAMFVVGLCIVRLALAQLPRPAQVAADADLPEGAVRLRLPKCDPRLGADHARPARSRVDADCREHSSEHASRVPHCM